MTVTFACCCSWFNNDRSSAGVNQQVKKDLRNRASRPHSCPYLSELDGEDGMRPATDVIHPSCCGGTIDISCIHKFFYITIILY